VEVIEKEQRMARTRKEATPQPLQYERPADILRRVPISRSTLYELIWAGEIPSIKARGMVLVPAGAIDDFLARQGSAAKDHSELAHGQLRDRETSDVVA
jgi:excisionase family DNA binding protein